MSPVTSCVRTGKSLRTGILSRHTYVRQIVAVDDCKCQSLTHCMAQQTVQRGLTWTPAELETGLGIVRTSAWSPAKGPEECVDVRERLTRGYTSSPMSSDCTLVDGPLGDFDRI